jgi:hypothetical protein
MKNVKNCHYRNSHALLIQINVHIVSAREKGAKIESHS